MGASIFTGCARQMELVPAGQVTIYKELKGGEVIGVTSAPLPVNRLVYPDKTDYVVEVSYQGKRGYVRDGSFHLSMK